MTCLYLLFSKSFIALFLLTLADVCLKAEAVRAAPRPTVHHTLTDAHRAVGG